MIFILSPVDSLNCARTFQLQEKEQELKEKGQVFGQSCLGLLAKYDQNTHSLKMFQLSLFEEEPESLEILPKSGMTVNGKLWEQTMWAHPTGGRGSGLWHIPTPTPSDAYIGDLKSNQTKPGSMHSVNLPKYVKMWLTPSTVQIEPTEGRREKRKAYRESIGRKDVGPVGSKSHTHMDKRDYLCAKVKDPEQPTGSLNPQWVEWLMGYPIGWTDLKD